MNVELLLNIKEMALEYPEHVSMHDWLRVDFFSQDEAGTFHDSMTTHWADSGLFSDYRGNPAGFAACNTTACIAGWTMVLTPVDEICISNEIALAAQGRLGLDVEQATRLFYLDAWPTQFKTAHDTSETPQARAQAVADRIDHFIATEGEE